MPSGQAVIGRRVLLVAGLSVAAAAHEAAASIATSPSAIGARELRLAAAAAVVKTQGALSGGGLAAKGLISPAAQASLALPGFDARASDVLLRLFFSTSQVVMGHVLSTTPVIGYYSPTLDLWWLTRWTDGVRGPLLNEAKIVPGGMIAAGGRGQSPTGPRWLADLRRSTFIEALRETSQAAFAEFRAEFTPASSEPPRFFDRLPAQGQDLLRRRATAYAIRIADFQDDARLHGIYREVLRRLNEPAPEPPNGLSPEARKGFAMATQAAWLVRARLAPVAAFRIANTWFLAAAGPSSGRALLLAAVDVKAAEPVVRLALLDTGEIRA